MMMNDHDLFISEILLGKNLKLKNGLGEIIYLQNIDKMCLNIILQTIRTVKPRRIQSTQC